MAPPPQVGGLYADYEGLNSSWWEDPDLNGDPRSMIMLQGMLPDTPPSTTRWPAARRIRSGRSGRTTESLVGVAPCWLLTRLGLGTRRGRCITSLRIIIGLLMMRVSLFGWNWGYVPMPTEEDCVG